MASRRLVTRGEEPVRLRFQSRRHTAHPSEKPAKGRDQGRADADSVAEHLCGGGEPGPEHLSATEGAWGNARREPIIATIPGKGYQFVCEVREIGGAVMRWWWRRKFPRTTLVEETTGGESRTAGARALLQSPQPRSCLLVLAGGCRGILLWAAAWVWRGDSDRAPARLRVTQPTPIRLPFCRSNR